VALGPNEGQILPSCARQVHESSWVQIPPGPRKILVRVLFLLGFRRAADHKADSMSASNCNLVAISGLLKAMPVT